MSLETFMDYEIWGDMILNSEVYKKRVFLISFDEAHILESWWEFDIKIVKTFFFKKHFIKNHNH